MQVVPQCTFSLGLPKKISRSRQAPKGLPKQLQRTVDDDSYYPSIENKNSKSKTRKVAVLRHLVGTTSAMVISGEAMAHLERRLKKQAKYSALETLSLSMLKANGIYKKCRALVRRNNIALHKNYSIIALRLGLLHFHLVNSQQMAPKQAIEQIIGFMEDQLMSCLKKKYLNNQNYEIFVKMVSEKNSKDIQIFRELLASQGEEAEILNATVRRLYDEKENGMPIRLNKNLCSKILNILLGARDQGFAFHMSTLFEEQLEISSQGSENSEEEQSRSSKRSRMPQTENESQPPFQKGQNWNGLSQFPLSMDLEELISLDSIQDYLQSELNQPLGFVDCFGAAYNQLEKEYASCPFFMHL